MAEWLNISQTEDGFIRSEDNNSYFVHHSQLKGEHIDRGYYVSFKPYKTD